MNVQVVIPYAQLNEHRDRLFRYVLEFYDEIEMRVVLGTASNDGSSATFNHPKAINAAVEKSDADVLVICDADTLPSGDWMGAIEKVGLGIWPWSMPQRYRKLGASATWRILEGSYGVEGAQDDECDWVGDGVSWAGFQIVRRESFLHMGGWDERFIGWGSDDTCFGLAMDTLVGKHVRFDGHAEHLWHPQTPDDSYRHANWGEQRKITEEYMEAAGDSESMAKVVEGSGSSFLSAL